MFGLLSRQQTKTGKNWCCFVNLCKQRGYLKSRVLSSVVNADSIEETLMVTSMLFVLCIVFGVLLAFSLSANAYLFYLLRKIKKDRPMTRDAQMLLSDILRGNGLVRIKRIAPEDVFLWSPNSR